MKSFLVMVLVVLFTSPVFAQEDSTKAMKIVESAVGVMYMPSYSEKGDLSHNINGRVGAHLKLSVADSTDLNVRGILIYSNTDSSYGFGHFWIEKHRADGSFFKIGFMPRPVSEARPSPTNVDAQFEAPGTSVITGASTGALVGYNLGSSVAKIGVYYDEASKSIEYNAGIGCNDILGFYANVSGLYSREHYGFSAKLKNKFIELIGFWESNQTTSGICELNFNGIKPFYTIVYDCVKKEVDSKVGITKRFPVRSGIKDLTCLIGGGYNPQTKNTSLYFWMYF